MTLSPVNLSSNRSPYDQTQLARYGIAKPELLTNKDCPVEYVTGKCEFAGLVLTVNPDVLIPRLETEEMIGLIAKSFSQKKPRESQKVFKYLDMGTGSGAIGLGLSKTLCESNGRLKIELTLSDCSSKALEIAAVNANLLGQLTQNGRLSIELIEADLWEVGPNSPKSFGRYDLITANLPYIPSPRIKHLPNSVKDFEPHLALDGGPEGLSLIERFLKKAPNHLAPAGEIWLEVDHTHDLSWFKQNISQFNSTQLSDAFGQKRFVKLELKT